MGTKDFLGKFSFQDILAYLLPGIAVMLALVFTAEKLELLKSPVKEPDLFSGILFFLISFIMGIISSGIANSSMKVISRIFGKIDPKKEAPNSLILANLEEIFKNKIGIIVPPRGWNKHCFMIARDLVYQLMPNAASSSYRQGGLRLLRAYLISPVLLWSVILFFVVLYSGASTCKITFECIGITVIGVLTIIYLWKESYENRKREVEYIYGALIALKSTTLW